MHFVACINGIAGCAKYLLPVSEVSCGVAHRAAIASLLVYDVSLGHVPSCEVRSRPRPKKQCLCLCNIDYRLKAISEAPCYHLQNSPSQGECAGWSMGMISLLTSLHMSSTGSSKGLTFHKFNRCCSLSSLEFSMNYCSFGQ